MNSRRIYQLMQAIRKLQPDYDFERARQRCTINYTVYLENEYFKLEKHYGRDTD